VMAGIPWMTSPIALSRTTSIRLGGGMGVDSFVIEFVIQDFRRERKSVVEWPFVSPTISTRPP
jgi:hypothetical protein